MDGNKNKSSSNDSHRCRAEEIEDGEINPGGGGGCYALGSDTEDEEGTSRPATCKRSRLEDILALPSPTPSSSGSEGTISDHGGAGDDAAPVAARGDAPFPCHLCNKKFSSKKEVHGHMRVHQAENDKEMPPQPAAAPVQHLAPLPGASRSGGPYRCKYEGCGMEYKTHQGLGGHVAGHINRDKLAAGARRLRRRQAGGQAPMQLCGKEFLTGVALGDHKRKHYKKDLDLTLSLAPPGQLAAPPMPAPAPAAIAAAAALPPAETEAEVAEHGDGAEPVRAPPTTGVARNVVVRILGVDVEKPVDDAEEQDGYQKDSN